jgi:transcriptional regulator of acetoin/glycerol metabolism
MKPMYNITCAVIIAHRLNLQILSVLRRRRDQAMDTRTKAEINIHIVMATNRDLMEII